VRVIFKSIFRFSFKFIVIHHYRWRHWYFWRIIIIHMRWNFSMWRIGWMNWHLVWHYMIMIRIRLVMTKIWRIHRIGRVHLRQGGLMHLHRIWVMRRIVVWRQHLMLVSGIFYRILIVIMICIFMMIITVFLLIFLSGFLSLLLFYMIPLVTISLNFPITTYSMFFMIGFISLLILVYLFLLLIVLPILFVIAAIFICNRFVNDFVRWERQGKVWF